MNLLRRLGALLLVGGVASTAAAEPAGSVTLTDAVSVFDGTNDPAVALAVADLLEDFERVLGEPAHMVDEMSAADIAVQIAPSVGPERWVRVVNVPITITGGDTLGAIYGIYEFARTELGVDPLWFWKDLPPEPRESINISLPRVESESALFRYRGWFVNDEDLLTEWKDPSGPRFIRYPYYGQVISLEVADRIYEAVLRSGGNLIIPASFVDVMNPPEAALVQRAAERGLYVTQHHIEPLGVSHFGFENYWNAKGEEKSFSYGDDPDSVRETWRVFAAKWRELAGDRVVWQLGLRGKGDKAIWTSDASVSREEAGRFISQAVAEQWDIVRDVDPREVPPATATLWAEGAELMAEESLAFPDGVTIVFSDAGSTQQMQQDFFTAERQPEREYGVYYHVGFWSSGPHLLQGTTPQRVKSVFDQIIEKGDTHYAIINVCNIREHVLGIQAAMTAMRGPWDADAFMRDWAPPCLHDSYALFLDSFIHATPERLIQDGTAFRTIRAAARDLREGKPDEKGLSVTVFDDAIAKLDRVIDEYPAEAIPERMRDFYDVHLLTQAQMWRALLQCMRALKLAHDDPARVADAEAAMEDFLRVRERGAQGRWENWYRGDTKVITPDVLRVLQKLRSELLPKGEQAAAAQ